MFQLAFQIKLQLEFLQSCTVSSHQSDLDLVLSENKLLDFFSIFHEKMDLQLCRLYFYSLSKLSCQVILTIIHVCLVRKKNTNDESQLATKFPEYLGNIKASFWENVFCMQLMYSNCIKVQVYHQKSIFISLSLFFLFHENILYTYF